MNWLLALASAVLLVLSVPRFDLSFLAAVALAPLLAALHRECRIRRQFLMGWMAGIVYWFAVCYWIQGVLERDGGLGLAGSWAAFLLFCLAKGLHLAVFAALAGMLIPKWYAIPAVAALWTGIERTHGPLGFTWFLLGNAGVGMSVPLRLAPYLGVYGLSFVFAMMAAALALVALRRPRKHLAWLLVLPLMYLLPPLPAPVRGAEEAVVVQPAVSQDTQWTPEALGALQQRMGAMSLSAALRAGDPAPRLILWPEMPAPLYYFEDQALREEVATIARTTGSNVLLGIVGRTQDGEPTNSAVMVLPSGELAGRYDKIRLVPFGEYVPPFFGFVNRITKEAGDFHAGSRIVVFPAGRRRAGAFICYESVFPDLVRQFVKEGGEVLLNLSNDGYFARSAAREQHLKIARMRAVENRRWLIRATNDGITAAIDPAGRVTHQIEPYQPVSVRTQFSWERGITPYSRYGDWFAWGSLAAGLALVAASQWPSYRR